MPEYYVLRGSTLDGEPLYFTGTLALNERQWTPNPNLAYRIATRESAALVACGVRALLGPCEIERVGLPRPVPENPHCYAVACIHDNKLLFVRVDTENTGGPRSSYRTPYILTASRFYTPEAALYVARSLGTEWFVVLLSSDGANDRTKE